MKLTTLIILGIALSVSARTVSQTITFSAKEISLEKAFTIIKEQTGFLVFYRKDLLEATKPVTITAINEPLSSFLSSILAGQSLHFIIENRTVSIQATDNGPRAKTDQPADLLLFTPVAGIIKGVDGEPLANINVQIKGTATGTTTDAEGHFTIQAKEGDLLVISGIGFVTREIRIGKDVILTIFLEVRPSVLDTAAVVMQTGYQVVPKERATGSFVQIDNALINRSVSTNILDRLRGVTNGLYSDVGNSGTTGNALGINIRGLSTINSNTTPLIVIDHFAYDGDINAINPNDIESVTILKDASAASIWGARAGNGVIVLTTKKGVYGKKTSINIHSNNTVSARPNLFYTPQISTSDYISLEESLYAKGFYASRIDDNYHPAISPVLEVLDQKSRGQISNDDADTEIKRLSGYDVRNDIKKYLYRRSFNTQNSISIDGGSALHHFYLSLGYDKNKATAVGDDYQRSTLDFNNTNSFLNKKLEVTSQVFLTETKNWNNSLTNVPFSGSYLPTSLYPYARLKDDAGNHLTIAQYRQTYIDTVGGGKLLDWNYRPIDEINLADNITQTSEQRVNLGVSYRLPFDFTIDAKYQYGKTVSELNNYHDIDGFYARDLINTYTQIDPSTGSMSYPVARGGIADKQYISTKYKNFRLQLGYLHVFMKKHEVNAIAGTEIRDAHSQSNNLRYYGYDPEHATFAVTDYTGLYNNYPFGFSSTIPTGLGAAGSTDRFVSYYSNLSYSYQRKYIISGSIRSDGANIFGVSTNKKRIPLWSTGFSWAINKEKFYQASWLPLLRLRTTFGYQGNANNALSSYLTISSGYTNDYNMPAAVIFNLPNPNFRWERTSQWNIGFDFEIKKALLSGSIEYYYKSGSDLIGPTPLAPSTGQIRYIGNVANMTGRGVDINLTSHLKIGKFLYDANLIINYNTNKVTAYYVKPTNNSGYTGIATITPVEGRPVYGLYSYAWAGLDSAGNPVGVLDGKKSVAYSSIINKNDLSQLIYNGSRTPLYFGSFRHTVTFSKITLSVNLSYKLGYLFRRPSVDYYSLYNIGANYATGDYAHRWKSAGDETKTTIPSAIYPLNSTVRDQFYGNSAILAEKGDHVRINDLNLSYELVHTRTSRIPLNSIKLFAYINNIGILWKANKAGIDPDFVPRNSYGYNFAPSPRSYSIGIRIVP